MLTLLAVTFVVALATKFVVQPELYRVHAFGVLRESNSILPPIVTMFSGRSKGDFDPVAEPAWFTARQSIARMLFIDTVPWHDDCALLIAASDESSIRLARTCADLKAFATDKRLSIIRTINSEPDPPEPPDITFPPFGELDAE